MVIIHSLSLQSLRETFEARASEWMLTGAILSLAVVFFLNHDMFHRDAFDGLRNIMDNRLGWAWLFTLVGILGGSVLVINGSYYRTPHFRTLSAFLRAGVWFLLCLGFARNGSVLIALSPWIFFLDVYNAKRAAREAGSSEFVQRYITMKQGSAHAGHPKRSYG